MATTEDRIWAAAVRLFVEKGTTQITISELAQEANVARGTLYRNVGSIEGLFDRVVGEVTADLHQRVSASFDAIDDSAARLATGIRMWVRYAHENPLLGRFAVKFGLSEEALRTWMSGPPQSDVGAGLAVGRYALDGVTVESVASLVLGATISAMWMVLEGHQTWREAGTTTAELILRALGIAAAEAHRIATQPLPPLAPSADVGR
ncbi:TetR/AcrR family transcriptional regulator [Mycobacterium sp. OTB74]|jgi:AcrR family transcriptional regulator|uniref:TetR/AcrR family transcriptional regulator n=1 Tax=Mycobacterium sp. OTB74 TaxID=1853452 RepID=UPI00247672A1|nr:TetR/AcrR family transcriptional regulator [Mycobacterium sp. OTB74]MDH6245059.1 AcrR family transcriptional regulator [Mycobacterium sp. OTB74]